MKSWLRWYSGSTRSSARKRPAVGVRNEGLVPPRSPKAGCPTAASVGVSNFVGLVEKSVCSGMSRPSLSCP
jgi:hypothetical protein